MSDSDSSTFSLERFAVALITVGAGAAAGMAAVPVVGTHLGLLLGGFIAGLAFEGRPVLESGVAAVVAGWGVLLASKIIGDGVVDAIVGLISMDPQILFLSTALSFGAGALGAHFGDDLRDGLTEPVEETGSGP
jgi:hypothetical protein